jgi:hypothetical protein
VLQCSVRAILPSPPALRIVPAYIAATHPVGVDVVYGTSLGSNASMLRIGSCVYVGKESILGEIMGNTKIEWTEKTGHRFV